MKRDWLFAALASAALGTAWHFGYDWFPCALTALLPVYARLLRKINTSVAVEDNGKLDAIDISGEA